MGSPALVDGTGDDQCDRVVQGLLGVFETAFPGRVHSCYLRGSRASGTNVEGSDLDLYIVFKDRFVDVAEFERADDLCRACARISPVLLEVMLIGECRLYDADSTDAALDLRLGTRLLHGDDVRATLPDFDTISYVRSVVHTPYYSYSFPEQRDSRLVHPLRHIDPTGEFYGFDQWFIPGPGALDVPSTKLLVATVGWTATAIVAMRTGSYVRDKSAAVDLYREHVGDEWTQLVGDVHASCRNAWHYLVPEDNADRQVLRDLCERALSFENHYLQLYRDYQLRELASENTDRLLIAIGRLDQISFPHDTAVNDALRSIVAIDQDPLSPAAASTLATYAELRQRPQ